jgi:putative aldouronate transport system permease protein
LIFILVGLCLASTIAIILNELRSKFLSKFYQSVIFLPYFLSWVVVAYLVYSVLAPNGFYNKALVGLFHLAPKDWYISPEVWPYIIPIVYT